MKCGTALADNASLEARGEREPAFKSLSTLLSMLVGVALFVFTCIYYWN